MIDSPIVEEAFGPLAHQKSISQPLKALLLHLSQVLGVFQNRQPAFLPPLGKTLFQPTEVQGQMANFFLP